MRGIRAGFLPHDIGGNTVRHTKVDRRYEHLAWRREAAKGHVSDKRDEPQAPIRGDARDHDDEDEEHLEVGPREGALHVRECERAEDTHGWCESADED